VTSKNIACYLDRNNKMAVRSVSDMRRTTNSLFVILFTVSDLLLVPGVWAGLPTRLRTDHGFPHSATRFALS